MNAELIRVCKDWSIWMRPDDVRGVRGPYHSHFINLFTKNVFAVKSTAGVARRTLIGSARLSLFLLTGANDGLVVGSHQLLMMHR